jgi:hypothetical protein
MTREHRYTLRLAETELAAIKDFADERHVLPSVALRRLVSVGLMQENRARPPQTGRQTPEVSRR